MPNGHDRIAILATKHGTDHLSETPGTYGKYNYYRITSSSLGKIGTYNTLAPQGDDSMARIPEGELLPAPIPRPEGGYY